MRGKGKARTDVHAVRQRSVRRTLKLQVSLELQRQRGGVGGMGGWEEERVGSLLKSTSLQVRVKRKRKEKKRTFRKEWVDIS